MVKLDQIIRQLNVIVFFKAKQLGAKWDLARKTWYIEDVENIEKFLDWIDDKLKQPTKSVPFKHPKFKKPKRRR